MKEAGLEFNTKPKIHCKDRIVEDHIIYTEEHNLRMPLKLKLDGALSYFETIALTGDEIEYPDNLLMICLPLDSP